MGNFRSAMSFLNLKLYLLCFGIQPGIGQSFFLASIPHLDADDAMKICSQRGGRLILPLNRAHNEEIQAYLQSTDVASSWLDMQITPTFWHQASDGIRLYDQGCYEFNNATDLIPFQSQSLCSEYCTQWNYSFVALQHNINSNFIVKCRCLHDVPISSQLSDSHCFGNCGSSKTRCGSAFGNTLRIYAASTIPVPVSKSWHWGPLFYTGGLCTRHTNGNDPFQLEGRSCTDREASECATNRNNSSEITMNWFESRRLCRDLGTDLAHLPNGWSEVTAWRWTVRGEPSNHAFYTKWARGYPNVKSGSCIIMSRDGLWQTVNCSDTYPVVCQEDTSSASVNVGSTIAVAASVIVGLFVVVPIALNRILQRCGNNKRSGRNTQISALCSKHNDIPLDNSENMLVAFHEMNSNDLLREHGSNAGGDIIYAQIDF